MKVKGTSGFWHDDCDLEERTSRSDGIRSFFCKEHNQWTYVFPVKRTYTYDVETGLDPITIVIRDV